MVAQVIVKAENIIDIEGEDNDSNLFGKPVTKGQIAIIRLLSEGMKNKEIADVLFLSTRTVETQILLACKRLGVHNRTALMCWAAKNGLV